MVPVSHHSAFSAVVGGSTARAARTPSSDLNSSNSLVVPPRVRHARGGVSILMRRGAAVWKRSADEGPGHSRGD